MLILNSKNRGVTLIELSIVLAILGVLIIATISGRSLITISRATATMQQLSDRTLAMQVFQNTYECLPGDCVDATTKISASNNGNGNNIIEIDPDGNATTTTDAENGLVEYHLISAKLFTRTPLQAAFSAGATSASNQMDMILPKSKIPYGYISNAHVGGAVNTVIGGVNTTVAATRAKINDVVINKDILQIIDTKSDDGVANTGSFKCASALVSATVNLTATLATDYTADCIGLSVSDV